MLGADAVMRTRSKSEAAGRAIAVVEGLQRRFVAGLEAVSREGGFEAVEWLRDGGRHGGGVRFAVGDTAAWNRGSVNVSHVHYDDLPERRLASATALSTIIHPDNPHAPSIHMHVSWTEGKGGSGSWRVMADLNPAIEESAPTAAFEAAVRAAAGSQWEHGRAQGDKYFFIPALGRHRGVTHFYLEAYATDDPAADEALARGVIEAGIDAYCELLGPLLGHAVTEADRARQLAYHTVYAFQVLTLDRGTTSGLLVHDENDVGIMGSLPARIDRDLLASWIDLVAPPQNRLVRALVDALPRQMPTPISDETKRAFAGIVRDHYRTHPEALDLQASGDVVPPTVENHR
jgi:coproporphyrinogen III oxidase